MRIFFAILLSAITTGVLAQRDTLPPKAELNGDIEANGYTVIYPLGWSEDGHYAYIFQDINARGGADVYSYHMIVHKDKRGRPEYLSKTHYNLEEDTTYHYVYNLPQKDQDTTFWGYSFFRNVYWKEKRDTINKVLDYYKIKRSNERAVVDLDSLTKYDISISVENERDTKNAIILDRKMDVFLHVKGTYKRAIFSKTNALNADGWAMDQYGNYTDILYYEIGGVIQSPYSDHYLLYLVEYTMGFEETAERIILLPFSKVR